MQPIELKACPFCGHKAEDYDDVLYPTGQGWKMVDGVRVYVRDYRKENLDGQVWKVVCPEDEGGCGATVFGDSGKEVIALWNRRTAL